MPTSDELKQKALELHKKLKGKIEIKSKISVKNEDDLSLVYSPGVAEPCRKIAEDKKLSYDYTMKGNTVAIVTDGSAVLGLGNIGADAALPVMEGKSILLKDFAGVNCVPLCINTQDPEKIIEFCRQIEPNFGAINLEDISAPNCVTIERRLQKELNIPVFHDDQHGTAIVVGAAIINACRLTGKKLEDLKVLVAGTGASGSSIIKKLHKIGIRCIQAFNSRGIVHYANPKSKDFNFLTEELLENYLDNFVDYKETLEEALEGKDVFIGVSTADLINTEMVRKMNKDPFIFALANPDPEIMPEDAKKGGAKIIGTGRSDYPNQINNVLAFPGIFKGALDAKATRINEDMKVAAIYALANVIPENKLREDYIVPNPFDKNVVSAVAKAVREMAIRQCLIRK